MFLESSTKIIELEGRVGGLEKEVVTKDTYIKELEDIMVDKVSALIVIFGAILVLLGQNEIFRRRWSLKTPT